MLLKELGNKEARKNTRIIWVDVETDGVDEREHEVTLEEKVSSKKCHLLQIATHVTDGNLNILDGEGFEAKVYYSVDEVNSMKKTTVPFVIDMHNTTNLWENLTSEGIELRKLDSLLLGHFEKYAPGHKSWRLAGNSLTLDRNFMREYVPMSFDHLHHRSFDVSTMSGLYQMMTGETGNFDKPHDARDDIRMSIEELRYYLVKLFGENW